MWFSTVRTLASFAERFRGFHEWQDRACLIAGQQRDGIECLLLIVEPAFERHSCEIDLLLYGVVELRAT